jgi:hypothetical protein
MERPVSWFKVRRGQRERRWFLAVLGAVAGGDRHCTEIQASIGGNSGRIYVALVQLERAGEVFAVEEGTPRLPRRAYYLTANQEPRAVGRAVDIEPREPMDPHRAMGITSLVLIGLLWAVIIGFLALNTKTGN